MNPIFVILIAILSAVTAGVVCGLVVSRAAKKTDASEVVSEMRRETEASRREIITAQQTTVQAMTNAL
ncbi:MAG: hypothetical protein II328_02785, partial [Clostridia bacterium]|nr:hypothetical protein [Clostridia bacterium]